MVELPVEGARAGVPASGLSLVDWSIGDMLRWAAAARPDAPALVEGTAGDAGSRRRWTHSQLLDQAERGAHALLARYSPGERVAIWAPNSADWVLAEFAFALAGVTIVGVNPALRDDEVAYILGNSGAVGVFHGGPYRSVDPVAVLARLADRLPRLRAIESLALFGDPSLPRGAGSLPATSPGAIAQIQYTSGTTGFPKGARLAHRAFVNNARLFAERLGLTTGGRLLHALPMFHTSGSVQSTLGTLSVQGTQIIGTPGFDPALMLDLIEQERPECAVCVPTMLYAMLAREDFWRRDLSTLRLIAGGGSPVPAALIEQLRDRLGVGFSNVYGQTEAIVISQTDPARDDAVRQAETIGRPLPHCEIRLIDPKTGGPAAAGQSGDLQVRGYNVMAGYLPGTDARSPIDADGWLSTGDLCTLDDEGYLRIVGRLKDMIIRGGENVYPREIEDVLCRHPSIREAAVIGVPDELWGEQVCAVVIADESARDDVEALALWARERLAAYKSPKLWAFVDAFPLTGSGKVRKVALREAVASGALPAVPAGGSRR
ncbi:MAG: class I adenylate-forming enzyme family protein [Pseudomonadota bacterium]